jgi:hypothetical protein
MNKTMKMPDPEMALNYAKHLPPEKLKKLRASVLDHLVFNGKSAAIQEICAKFRAGTISLELMPEYRAK